MPAGKSRRPAFTPYRAEPDPWVTKRTPPAWHGVRPGGARQLPDGTYPLSCFAAFRACRSVRDYARVVADLREPVTGLPKRQPASRLAPAHIPAPPRETEPRPGASAGRHRRPVPDGLPPEAPALVLAAAGYFGTPDVAAEIASIVRVDNPSLDVRMARVGTGGDDPAGLPAVLASAATMRPDGRPGRHRGAAARPALPGRDRRDPLWRHRRATSTPTSPNHST